MLLDPNLSLPDDVRKLIKLYRSLEDTDRQSLFAFAEFLAQRATKKTPAPVAHLPPTPLDRPAKETVIKAIKRLSASYPMLDKSLMLEETSTLMTQHVIQGRGAVEVIDELEVVFRRAYQKFDETQESAADQGARKK